MPEVKLPDSQNIILIMFDDSFSKVDVTYNPILWDVLKNLTDQEIVITKILQGYKLSIKISMDKLDVKSTEI